MTTARRRPSERRIDARVHAAERDPAIARAGSRAPGDGLTRRGALAAAGAALLVGACGGSDQRGEETPRPRTTATYYPEDFGAAGNGRTDDTEAIQACIDEIAAAGGTGTIQFGPKTYLVNGRPRHDRDGNAILALPHGEANGTLRMRGAGRATIIRTAVTGASYSETHGAPSVIGGPTPEQKGDRGQTARYTIEIADLTVVAPADPTVGGIDLSRQARCRLEDVYVHTADPRGGAQPVNPWAFGVRLPDGLNYGRIVVDALDVYGFYAGIVSNTAHTQLRQAIVKWCHLGYGLTGSGQFNAIDPHPSHFGQVGSEWCALHMGGWSPTEGARSLPAGAPFFLLVDLWDIGDAPGGRWYSTSAHLADADDQLQGRATYLRVKAGEGRVAGPLVVRGGANFALTELGG